MPNISVVLPEVDQSVSRPIAIGVIGQLQQIIKLPKDMKIFFPGPMGTMQAPGSSIDDIAGSRDAMFESNRIGFIEVEEDYDVYGLNNSSIGTEEQIPIFEDPRLGVSVRPEYATTNVKINVRYRTTSSNEADAWLRDMRMRISRYRDIILHKLDYHFSIPESLNDILINIWENRAAVEPYGDSLRQYLLSHMTERTTFIGDTVGKNTNMVFTETQKMVQGMFDFEGMPDKPTKDESTGTWSVVFSYKFSYEKPIGCTMKYPIMVHNQLLNKEYTDFSNPGYDPTSGENSFSRSLYAMNAFRMDTLMNNVSPPDPYIRIPSFDDFVPKQIPTGCGTAMLVLSSVADDKRSLINLKELGDIVLDQDIMQFIEEVEWPYICQQFKSVIYLALFKNEYQKSNGSIVCDQNLDIKSTFDLSLRDSHRVHFGLCVDLTLLPREAIQRLTKYPKAMVKIMGSMNDLLRMSGDFKRLGDKRRLTDVEFSDVYYILTGYGYNDGRVGRPKEYYNAAPGRFDLLDTVDPRVISSYRSNMVTRKTILGALLING